MYMPWTEILEDVFVHSHLPADIIFQDLDAQKMSRSELNVIKVHRERLFFTPGFQPH